MEDNIISARERLFNQYFDLYNKKFKSNINQKLLDCIKYILKLNLVHADALSLKNVKNDTPDFSKKSIQGLSLENTQRNYGYNRNNLNQENLLNFTKVNN